MEDNHQRVRKKKKGVSFMIKISFDKGLEALLIEQTEEEDTWGLSCPSVDAPSSVPKPTILNQSDRHCPSPTNTAAPPSSSWKKSELLRLLSPSTMAACLHSPCVTIYHRRTPHRSSLICCCLLVVRVKSGVIHIYLGEYGFLAWLPMFGCCALRPCFLGYLVPRYCTFLLRLLVPFEQFLSCRSLKLSALLIAEIFVCCWGSWLIMLLSCWLPEEYSFGMG
ncbi:hypothetical protein U1Q18_007469 [Sarracenia purpurea var. burkii]